MEERAVPTPNATLQSVAAMMRRGLSLAESHLILPSPVNGQGNLGEPSARG
jgi:hypothetical protein